MNNVDVVISKPQVHTDPIIVKATWNKGAIFYKDNREQIALPIRCVWYSETEEEGMTKIEGAEDNYYQPCLEDVGRRYFLK